jgi:hypothetical protein
VINIVDQSIDLLQKELQPLVTVNVGPGQVKFPQLDLAKMGIRKTKQPA